jgi:predicted O-methyltransferase YrrM
MVHPGSFKYMGKWIRYMFFTAKKDNISAALPWMNLQVIDWLGSYLKKDMKLFEWGSGGSTFFYANLVEEVISIEYDEGYYELVKNKLEDKGKDNVILKPVLPQEKGEMKSFCPLHLGSSFDNYVESIDEYPDRFFDVIVVDGRQRNQCFKHALRKVKEGGIIVFDNFEREIYKKSQYHDNISYTMYESLMPFSFVLGSTAIFVYENKTKD